jgi:hypothetical protein
MHDDVKESMDDFFFIQKNWMWIVSNLSKKRGTMQWLETQQTR